MCFVATVSQKLLIFNQFFVWHIMDRTFVCLERLKKQDYAMAGYVKRALSKSDVNTFCIWVDRCLEDPQKSFGTLMHNVPKLNYIVKNLQRWRLLLRYYRSRILIIICKRIRILIHTVKITLVDCCVLFVTWLLMARQ